MLLAVSLVVVVLVMCAICCVLLPRNWYSAAHATDKRWRWVSEEAKGGVHQNGKVRLLRRVCPGALMTLKKNLRDEIYI
jgi:hypothetical protein